MNIERFKESFLKRDPSIHPMVDGRIIRVKNPTMTFFCPLCSVERSFNYTPKLTVKNYIQILATSVVLILLTAPLMKAYSIIFLFITWAGFEGFRRMLFRKEIPCPHCGFDASWYKRDVKVAKKLVKNFWEDRAPEAQGPEIDAENPSGLQDDLEQQNEYTS